MNKSVLLALSGGIDSTYALLNLINQGYDVVCVTFKINNNSKTLNSINEASKIANKFGVQHLVVDYENVFKIKVIDNFINTYKKGRTPNPCVVCNKLIKFGELDYLRKKLNIDYIATGHYARIEEIDNKYFVKKAIFKQKDQSYFLNQISLEVIKKCIFPLGDVNSKDEVREILKQNNIEIEGKKESQDICFIENMKCIEFLKEYISKNEGIIRNSKDEILGKHDGVSFYTIGQRRNLGISSNKPLFIKEINANKNEIIVGEQSELYVDEVTIKNVNILAEEFLEKGLTAKSKYKGFEFEIKAVIKNSNNELNIKFKDKQKNISPGQYLVIYYNEYLVLGGEIV